VTGNADSGYTVDKTTAEINAAYRENRHMVCNIGAHSSIPLTRVNYVDVTFTRTFTFQTISGAQYTRVGIAAQQISDTTRVTVTSGTYSEGSMKPLTINGTVYNGSKEVSMDIAPLVVEVTMDESTGEWVSTHPIDTILWAYYQGRLPICNFEGTLIPFIGYDDYSANFVLTSAAGNVFVTFMVGINRDNTVMVEIIETTSLPNPHVLAIGGKIYDGSEEKDFTDTINSMIDAKLGVIENGSY
jgi:hypothetical protein